MDTALVATDVLGMSRIEELTNADHVLNSMARCESYGGAGNGSHTHAAVKGFNMIFEKLTKTPELIRLLLQSEFHFEGVVNAYTPKCSAAQLLAADWYSSVFVLPPYSDMAKWMKKCNAERAKGKVVVCIMPSRTNTQWFHDHVLSAASNELRFIKGRITMPGFKNQSPYPDAICVFHPDKDATEEEEDADADEAGGHMFGESRSVAIMACSTSFTSGSTSFAPADEKDAGKRKRK